MIRRFCDECGAEITDGIKRTMVLRNDTEVEMEGQYTFLSQELCADCYKKALDERDWMVD